MNIPEILGGSAIIVSLLFVAYELRLSNKIASRDSRSGILNMWNEIARSQIENPNVVQLMKKLKAVDVVLTEEEEISARMMSGQFLNVCGLVNSAHTSGLMSADVVGFHLNIISMNTEGYPGLFPYISEYIERVGVVRGVGPATDRMLDLVS